jgi:L-asparagine transporter-like permease
MILFTHLKYREAVAEGRIVSKGFRMHGAAVANWAVLAFLVLIAVFLGIDPDTRVALFVAPVWFAILAIGYRLVSPEDRQQLA